MTPTTNSIYEITELMALVNKDKLINSLKTFLGRRVKVGGETGTVGVIVAVKITFYGMLIYEVRTFGEPDARLLEALEEELEFVE